MEDKQDSTLVFELNINPIIWTEKLEKNDYISVSFRNNLIKKMIIQEKLSSSLSEQDVTYWNLFTDTDNNKGTLRFVTNKDNNKKYLINFPIIKINNIVELLEYIETYDLIKKENDEEEKIMNVINHLIQKCDEVNIFFSKSYSQNLNFLTLKKLILEENYDEVIEILFLINFLINFNDSNENVPAIIIGPNGCGKTKLINFLAKNIFKNTKLKVLKANESLNFREERYLWDISIDTLNIYEKDGANQKGENGISAYIPALINDNDSKMHKEFKKNSFLSKDNFNSRLLTVISIFQKFFPSFDISTNNEKRSLIFSKNNSKEFSWNELSDGEKRVFWILAKVITAEEKSWIFIDEPETHLNPAIFQKFWLEIIKIRSDCKFIFITHQHELFSIFENMYDLFVINNFMLPKMWDIKAINNINELSSDLLLKIYGSKEKKLFCEGELDYKVYSELFPEYQVISMQGKTEVIKAVTVIEKLDHHSLEAFGIIDRDENIFESKNNGKQEKKVKKLKNYNEIEMLLLDDVVLKAVIDDLEPKLKLNPKKLEAKLAAVNDNFFNYFKSAIDIIISRNKKVELDLIKKRITIDLNNDESIENSLKKFEEEIKDLNKKSETKKQEILKLVEKKDKPEILKICSLKEMVKDSNILGVKGYLERAVNLIQRDENLREEIRNLLNIKFK